MSDIIKLLPDSVANQIAAGEVVQRPASVVKELLENAVDAESTDIKLIVKDAGRTLIQVTDNGKGMSETDARMCFERHATSKINNAQDLFALTTMGFRGEALAAIASVARVELKTCTRTAPLGTEIIMEGSRIESQQHCQAQAGSTIAVKNLFFNTPARRNFLKSDTIEKTHITNEFIRVALANPSIAFSYYHNGQLCMQAPAGNLGSRILHLFGNHYKPRLIPIEESTQIVSIQGYVLKPEFARRNRNEQFIFVNTRFIKSAYLNNAVDMAFDELISTNLYPAFFLFLTIDPAQIDVNVHPTKTEIKFQDEKIIYQILKVAVRRSLGKYNVAPTLDFDRETVFDTFIFDKSKPVTPPVIDVNPDFNPFGNTKTSTPGQNLTSRANAAHWEKLFPEPERQPFVPENKFAGQEQSRQTIISPDWDKKQPTPQTKKFMQLHGRFILTSIKSGLMVIDQQRAHERILFEKYTELLENHKQASQTLLFPEKVQLSENDIILLNEIRDEISSLGFDISDFGNNSYMISAVPTGIPETENVQQLLETILENYRKDTDDLNLKTHLPLAKALARSLAVKPGKIMNTEEMISLTDELFSCQMPYQTPGGKPTLHIVPLEEIAQGFK